MTPPDAQGPRRHSRAWAFTERLNSFTRKFYGPAEVGPAGKATEVPSELPTTPCASCGRPLREHTLIRSTDAKMRLYCPTTE